MLQMSGSVTNVLLVYPYYKCPYKLFVFIAPHQRTGCRASWPGRTGCAAWHACSISGARAAVGLATPPKIQGLTAKGALVDLAVLSAGEGQTWGR